MHSATEPSQLADRSAPSRSEVRPTDTSAYPRRSSKEQLPYGPSAIDYAIGAGPADMAPYGDAISRAFGPSLFTTSSPSVGPASTSSSSMAVEHERPLSQQMRMIMMMQPHPADPHFTADSVSSSLPRASRASLFEDQTAIPLTEGMPTPTRDPRLPSSTASSSMSHASSGGHYSLQKGSLASLRSHSHAAIPSQHVIGSGLHRRSSIGAPPTSASSSSGHALVPSSLHETSISAASASSSRGPTIRVTGETYDAQTHAPSQRGVAKALSSPDGSPASASSPSSLEAAAANTSSSFLLTSPAMLSHPRPTPTSLPVTHAQRSASLPHATTASHLLIPPQLQGREVSPDGVAMTLNVSPHFDPEEDPEQLAVLGNSLHFLNLEPLPPAAIAKYDLDGRQEAEQRRMSSASIATMHSTTTPSTGQYSGSASSPPAQAPPQHHTNVQDAFEMGSRHPHHFRPQSPIFVPAALPGQQHPHEHRSAKGDLMSVREYSRSCSPRVGALPLGGALPHDGLHSASPALSMHPPSLHHAPHYTSTTPTLPGAGSNGYPSLPRSRLDHVIQASSMHRTSSAGSWSNASGSPSQYPSRPLTKTIWLGNLPAQASTATLMTMFGNAATIESCRIIPHKNCGFVTFFTPEDATSAKATLELSDLYRSSPIKVEYSRKSEEMNALASHPASTSAASGPGPGSSHHAAATSASALSTSANGNGEVSGGHARPIMDPHELHLSHPHPMAPSMVRPGDGLNSSISSGSSTTPNHAMKLKTTKSPALPHYKDHIVVNKPFSPRLFPQALAANAAGRLQHPHQHPQQQQQHATPAWVTGSAPPPLARQRSPSQVPIDAAAAAHAMEARPPIPTAGVSTSGAPLGPFDVPAPSADEFKMIPLVPRLVAPKLPSHIVKLDTLRAKLLRKKVENGAHMRDIDTFVREALPSAVELSMDHNGNLLLQKLLERGSDQHRLMLISACTDHLASMAVDRHSTWVVQKMIECADSNSQIMTILTALEHWIPALFIDDYGNYVIQKCLRLGTMRIQFIFDILQKWALEIASNKIGARAMRSCLENPNVGLPQQMQIAVVLIHYAPYLLLRPPGILLFHWFIDNSRIPNILISLVHQLMRVLPTLANHKLSVPILVKLLDQSMDIDARHLLVHEGLFGDTARLAGILYGTVEQRCDSVDVIHAQTSGQAYLPPTTTVMATTNNNNNNNHNTHTHTSAGATTAGGMVGLPVNHHAHMNQLLHPEIDASNDASLFAMSTFHRPSGGPPSDLGFTIVCKALDVIPLPTREHYIKRVLETARPMDRDYFGKLTQMCSG